MSKCNPRPTPPLAPVLKNHRSQLLSAPTELLHTDAVDRTRRGKCWIMQTSNSFPSHPLILVAISPSWGRVKQARSIRQSVGTEHSVTSVIQACTHWLGTRASCSMRLIESGELWLSQLVQCRGGRSHLSQPLCSAPPVLGILSWRCWRKKAD